MPPTTASDGRPDPTRPFYAAVGTLDAAVSFARTGLGEASSRLADVQSHLHASTLVTGLQQELKAFPARVEALLDDYVGELGDVVQDLDRHYDELAARGRARVGRIRHQEG